MENIINTEQIEYIKTLRKHNYRLMNSMETFAKEKQIPILNWNAKELLEFIIMILKPKRVLEIGTAIAYSTITIAKHLPEGSIIDSIEKSRDSYNLAKDFVDKSGAGYRINLIFGNASNIMRKSNENYDLIFIDSNKEDYIELFELSLELLNKNGVLFVDNLLWQGYAASKDVPNKYKTSTEQIRKFNKIFMSHPELKSAIFPVGDGVGIGIKLT